MISIHVKVSDHKQYLAVIRMLIFIVLLLDINECAVGNGGCDETCVNRNGSYSCQCDSDLQLLSDKQSCGCQ